MEIVFEEIINMYPKELDISNGIIHSNGGATFNTLIEIHDQVEEAVQSKSVEHSAMDWSIFQELHKIAKSEFEKQKIYIYPQKLNIENVVGNFNKNYQSILNEQEKPH